MKNIAAASSPGSILALQAQRIHERTRRGSPAAERDARAALERAVALEEEVRGIASSRGAALLAIVSAIVADGTAAFAAFDRYTELLDEASQNFRAAVIAEAAASTAHAAGALEAAEARRLADALEHARAVLRFRDRALEEAKRPARVPTIALPREARDEATADLVRMAQEFGAVNAHEFHRPGVDVTMIAKMQGRRAEPRETVWWILGEARALAFEGKGRQGRRDAAELKAELRSLFDARWAEHLATEGLPPLERDRLRLELR